MGTIGSLLLVEDSDDDECLFREALKATPCTAQVQRVKDAAEAIDALKRSLPHDEASMLPRPDLIITDLNMPKLDGFGLLKWLHQNPEFSDIPVVVLSASFAAEDIRRAYSLGANSFITKPSTVAELTRVLNVMLDFSDICQLQEETSETLSPAGLLDR